MTIKSNLRSRGLLASTIAGTFIVAGAALPASAAALTTDMSGAQQSDAAATSTGSDIILAQTTNFTSQFSDGNEGDEGNESNDQGSDGSEGGSDGGEGGSDGGEGGSDGGEGGSDGGEGGSDGGGEGGDD